MSDIRFNQWLHNSGTGGVSQVDGGHVGIGTTNPLIPVGAGNTAILNVGVVTASTYYGNGVFGDVNIGASASNTTIHSSGLFNGATPKLEVKLGGASNSYTRLINITNPGGQTGSESLGRVGIKLSLGSEASSGESNKSGAIYAESTSTYNNATALCFGTDNTERLRITSTGRINIGDTDQTQNVDQLSVTVGAQNAIDNVARFQSSAASSGHSETLVKIYKGAGYGGVLSGYITQGSDHGLKLYTANNNTLSERLRINSSGVIVAGNGGTNFGNASIQSFIAHGATAGESAFSAVDTSSVAAGVGGEIAFHGKYNTGAQDYAYLGHIRGVKENATAGNTACALTFHTRPNATAPIERLRILSDGKILIGSTNQSNNARLGNELCIVGTEAYTGMSITNYPGTNASHSPMVDFNRSRGTSDQSMTSVIAGDKLGELIFRGSNGSGFTDAVTLRSYADSVSGTTVNGRFEIGTTNGSHTAKMIVSREGYVTKPNNPAFIAGRTGGNQTFTVGVYPLNVARLNVGNHYNTSTYKFVAPVAGVYYFFGQVYYNNGSGSYRVGIRKTPNGGSAFMLNTANHEVVGNDDQQNTSIIESMAVGDAVDLYCDANISMQCYYNINDATYGAHTYFMGYLIG